METRALRPWRCVLTLLLCLAGAGRVVGASSPAASDSAGPSGPLGFFAGETREQVLAAVGPAAVKRQAGDMLELSTAPKSYDGFESYMLLISPQAGLVKIVCVGRDIQNDSYGTETRLDFDRIETALEKAYGDPSKSFDFLRGGSVWRDPNDFMMSLTKKERILATYWAELTPGSRVTSIMLEAKGLGPSKGYLSLGYEFSGFQDYAKSKRASADSVF